MADSDPGGSRPPRRGERSIREQLTDYAADPRLAERVSGVGRFLAAHWSVATPVTVLVLTVVRLLAVAHGDSDTALMILQHTDTTKLLTGIALQLVLLVVPASVVLLYWLGVLRWEGIVLAFGVAAAVIPLASLTLAALLVGGVFGARAFVPLDHPLRQHAWLGRTVLAAGLVVLGYLVGNHGPWLPREVVTFEQHGGNTTYIVDGYLLGYDQGRAVMLHTDSRIVTIENGAMTRRSPCQQVPPSAWDKTLAGIAFGWTHPTYDQCPSFGS